MSFEEIIDCLDEMEKFDVESPENRRAIREAIALLKTHPDNQPNEPLEVSVDVLRALTVAANSLRYNPGIDQEEAETDERRLINLRDELCQRLPEEETP